MAAIHALNILAKWRSVFAGWQLGTRADDDPECQAVRDHREVTIILRTEMNALIGLLVEKGTFTIEEWDAQLEREAVQMNRDYAERFPGMEATEHGISYDLATLRTAGTMAHWLP